MDILISCIPVSVDSTAAARSQKLPSNRGTALWLMRTAYQDYRSQQGYGGFSLSVEIGVVEDAQPYQGTLKGADNNGEGRREMSISIHWGHDSTGFLSVIL